MNLGEEKALDLDVLYSQPDKDFATVTADITNGFYSDKIYYTDNTPVLGIFPPTTLWKEYTTPLPVLKNSVIWFEARTTTGQVIDRKSIDISEISTVAEGEFNISTQYSNNGFTNIAKFYPNIQNYGNTRHNIYYDFTTDTNANNFTIKINGETKGATGTILSGETLEISSLTSNPNSNNNISFSLVNKSDNNIVDTKSYNFTFTQTLASGEGNLPTLDPNDPTGSITSFMNNAQSIFNLFGEIFKSFPTWFTSLLSFFMLAVGIVTVIRMARGS